MFAPGAANGNQSRDATDPAVCNATAKLIARNRCADNYLKASATRNNAKTNGPFTVGRLRDLTDPRYSDHVLYMTTRDFMPAVKVRVGSEVEALLEDYAPRRGWHCQKCISRQRN